MCPSPCAQARNAKVLTFPASPLETRALPSVLSELRQTVASRADPAEARESRSTHKPDS